MGIIRKIFGGKDDPDHIAIEHVFPLGDLVFSMPFEAEQGRHHLVVVEGSEVFLKRFEDFAVSLPEFEPGPFGKWIVLTDYILDSSLQLMFEPKSLKVSQYQFLVFVLREDLVRICDLHLANVAHVMATKGHVTCVDNPAPLPEDIGNGSTELSPTIIIPNRTMVN